MFKPTQRHPRKPAHHAQDQLEVSHGQQKEAGLKSEWKADGKAEGKAEGKLLGGTLGGKAEGAISKALHNLEYKAVCYFHELEDWQKDNPWILSGYRKLNYSYVTCLKTLFFLHNETGNVMSHLLGSLIFVGLAAYTLLEVLQGNWYDRIIFGFFFLCAVGCFFFSAFFHLFSCHSHEVSVAWNKCDYVGIMLMIVGSCYPSIYYSFHCTPQLQVLYLVTISLFGLASLPALVMDRFTEPKYRIFRTWLFVGLGLSGIIPMAHGIYLHTLEIAMLAGSLHWSLFMGSFYLFGAFLYAKQYPEKWWPGKFDLWLHSHQIFHFCVLTAAILHYVGLYEAYLWHVDHPCHVTPHWHLPDFVATGSHNLTSHHFHT